MNAIQKKQLEILEQTVAHYNSDNRCITVFEKCMYSPKTLGLEGVSDGCAIGRLLTPKLAKKLDVICEGKAVRTDEVFELLPKKLQAVGMSFLVEIQELHDTNDYWNKDGISEKGKKMVVILKNKLNLN